MTHIRIEVFFEWSIVCGTLNCRYLIYIYICFISTNYENNFKSSVVNWFNYRMFTIIVNNYSFFQHNKNVLYLRAFILMWMCVLYNNCLYTSFRARLTERLGKYAIKNEFIGRILPSSKRRDCYVRYEFCKNP